MTEFNPNCGRCGMLNSRGFCSLTACRYPSNAIVVEPKAIRGMMVNPQIEKSQTNADRIRAMSDEELAEWLDRLITHCNDGPCFNCFMQEACLTSMLDWLKQEVSTDG